MKSTTLGANDFLIIAIVLIIVGLGVVVWATSVGELYPLETYSATLFVIAFVFLGLFSIERFRKRHSDQYEARAQEAHDCSSDANEKVCARANRFLRRGETEL